MGRGGGRCGAGAKVIRSEHCSGDGGEDPESDGDGKEDGKDQAGRVSFSRLPADVEVLLVDPALVSPVWLGPIEPRLCAVGTIAGAVRLYGTRNGVSVEADVENGREPMTRPAGDVALLVFDRLDAPAVAIKAPLPVPRPRARAARPGRRRAPAVASIRLCVGFCLAARLASCLTAMEPVAAVARNEHRESRGACGHAVAVAVGTRASHLVAARVRVCFSIRVPTLCVHLAFVELDVWENDAQKHAQEDGEAHAPDNAQRPWVEREVSASLLH